MNPFAQMAQSLGAGPANIAPVTIWGNASHNGKTDQLRAALGCGPATAKELAEAAGLSNSGLVGALLANDIRKGLVARCGGTYRRIG